MDNCDSEDGVREEKVNVLGWYNLLLSIVNLFQLIEFVIAVALISWSSSCIISVLKLSGDNLLSFSSRLFNQHTVFLVGNVIIAVCYVLSRHPEEGNKSEKYEDRWSSMSQLKTTEDAGESVTPTPEEKQVRNETSGEENPNVQEGHYENATVETESETAIKVAIKQAVKQIERFRRTQSEKLKRQMSVKPHRELQRSATAGRGSLLVTSVYESSKPLSSKMVDKLSNEEFQLAVETFISKQQSFLKQEGMAEESGTPL